MNLADTSGGRILIVDDGTDACDIMTQALAFLGYPSTCVTNAEQGAALLAQHAWVGIFTELVLPRGNGFDVLQAARRSERNAAAPVIALSGYHEYRYRALAAGFDAFVAKPVELTRLRPVLAQLIRLEP